MISGEVFVPSSDLVYFFSFTFIYILKQMSLKAKYQIYLLLFD